MAATLPKPLFPSSHSSFALIDPTTEKFHRRFDRHGYLSSGLRRHVAISYVWSDWKDDPSDRLPNWDALRPRLIAVVGANAPAGLRKHTWAVTKCWIDCKCIDQDSVSDKSYWVPKMDEVYSEARCTVLLVRQSLSSIGKAVECLSCRFKDKLNSVDELLAPHNCLLSQSCTALQDLSPADEQSCLQTLKTFTKGTWRKRAWILQEILLSGNYLISWGEDGFMSLADAGTLTAALFYRHPSEAWLGEFANWCRRLWYLRQNYGEAQMYELCDANVLQLASDLEATVPCDRFYALCGILRLKKIQYETKHSAEEALQNVVSELVRNGRLSWLYAIRHPLGNDRIGFKVNDMPPFVLTRLEERLSANSEPMECSGGILSIPAIRVGTVSRIQPLEDFLTQAKAIYAHGTEPESEAKKTIYLRAPEIVRRLALDLVDPLLVSSTADVICDGLGISKDLKPRAFRIATILMQSLSLDTSSRFEEPVANGPLNLTVDASRIAAVTAWMLQKRFAELANEFSVVTCDLAPSKTPSGEKVPSATVIGSTGVTAGCEVFVVKGDTQLLIAAETNNGNVQSSSTVPASFKGMLFRPNAGEVIGPTPSSLVTTMLWKNIGLPRHVEGLHLQFDYTH